MKFRTSKIITAFFAFTLLHAQIVNENLKNEELTKGSMFKFSPSENGVGIYFVNHQTSELKYFKKNKILKVVKIENPNPDNWWVLGSDGNLDFIYVRNEGEGDAFYDLYSFDKVKGQLEHIPYELGKYLGAVGKSLYFMPPVEAEDIKCTKGIVVFNIKTKKFNRLFDDLLIATAKFTTNKLVVLGGDDSGGFWLRNASFKQFPTRK